MLFVRTYDIMIVDLNTARQDVGVGKAEEKGASKHERREEKATFAGKGQRKRLYFHFG